MIILVEDDAPVRHSLKLLLSMRDHDVRDCETGGDALAIEFGNDQTCLIADYLLPDIDGVALLGELHKRGWRAPAIMITGVFDPMLEGRARDAGYVTVFEKPLQHDQLVDAVDALTIRR
jgi:two-component system, LuxR family, response regulator FixJ